MDSDELADGQLNKLIKINIMSVLVKAKFYLKLFSSKDNKKSRNYIFRVFTLPGIKQSKHFAFTQWNY